MYIFLIITAIFTLITLLPFHSSNHWLVRVWEFPRLQIAVLILVNIIALVYFTEYSPWQLLLISINSILFIYQVKWILPYTRFYPTQVNSTPSQATLNSIKVMTCNVLMPNKSADKLINLVRQYQPDVLVTLETNLWWQNALAVLKTDYPYQVNKPLENLYGMHVFSRHKLINISVEELIQKEVPSIHCQLLLNNNHAIQFHFIHPAPPSPTENEYATARDNELSLIAKKVADNKLPTIVTGDLNDVAWSPSTRMFIQQSGFKDPRVGRGNFNTFHAKYWFLRWPLDHLFHNDHFYVKKIKRLSEIDSDHFPFLTELSLKTTNDDK